MHFGTFIDQKGNFIDTTHFPYTVKKYPFRGRGVYRIIGKVVEEFGEYVVSSNIIESQEYDALDVPEFNSPF